MAQEFWTITEDRVEKSLGMEVYLCDTNAPDNYKIQYGSQDWVNPMEHPVVKMHYMRK